MEAREQEAGAAAMDSKAASAREEGGGHFSR
jgi:hypothetical protein